MDKSNEHSSILKSNLFGDKIFKRYSTYLTQISRGKNAQEIECLKFKEKLGPRTFNLETLSIMWLSLNNFTMTL